MARRSYFVAYNKETGDNFPVHLTWTRSGARWLFRDKVTGKLKAFSHFVYKAITGRYPRKGQVLHHQKFDTLNDDPHNMELLRAGHHVSKHGRGLGREYKRDTIGAICNPERVQWVKDAWSIIERLDMPSKN